MRSVYIIRNSPKFEQLSIIILPFFHILQSKTASSFVLLFSFLLFFWGGYDAMVTIDHHTILKTLVQFFVRMLRWST